MTTDRAVLDTPHSLANRSLEELATIINREHSDTGASLGAAITHAIACGEALLSARAKIAPGEWQPWCAANLTFHESQAKRYYRLAYYRDHLPQELFQPFYFSNGKRYQPSINRALHYVEGLPMIFDPSAHTRTPENKVREMKRLYRRGLSYREIAEMVGVSKQTAARYCKPGEYARHREVGKRRRRLAAVARDALRLQEQRNARDLAAKTSGDARGETYSLIRKALDEAQRAVMAASDPGERAAINETMTSLHRAEDAIAKALKVP